MRKLLDKLLGRARPEPVPLTLYSRPGCHLCELMLAQIESARVSRPFRVTEVNIDTDPELQRRFSRSIPVLEIGGRVAFKGRLEAREFAAKFERLAGEWSRRAALQEPS